MNTYYSKLLLFTGAFFQIKLFSINELPSGLLCQLLQWKKVVVSLGVINVIPDY